MQAKIQSSGHLLRGASISLGLVLLLALPFWLECAARSPVFKPGDSAMGVVFGFAIAVLVWLRALFLECRDQVRGSTTHFTVSLGATVISLCSLYGVLRLSGILDFGRTYPDDRLFGFVAESLSGGGLACVVLLRVGVNSSINRTTWAAAMVLGFIVGVLLVYLPIPLVFQVGQWIRSAKNLAA